MSRSENDQSKSGTESCKMWELRFQLEAKWLELIFVTMLLTFVVFFTITRSYTSSPLDGAARIFISFYLYGYATSRNLSCLDPFIFPNSYAPEEKNHLVWAVIYNCNFWTQQPLFIIVVFQNKVNVINLAADKKQLVISIWLALLIFYDLLSQFVFESFTDVTHLSDSGTFLERHFSAFIVSHSPPFPKAAKRTSLAMISVEGRHVKRNHHSFAADSTSMFISLIQNKAIVWRTINVLLNTLNRLWFIEPNRDSRHN